MPTSAPFQWDQAGLFRALFPWSISFILAIYGSPPVARDAQRDVHLLEVFSMTAWLHTLLSLIVKSHNFYINFRVNPFHFSRD
jgi:hypothetical protein